MMRTLLFAFFTFSLSFALSAQLYNADFSTPGDGFPDHTTSSPPAAAPASAIGGASPNSWTVSYSTTPSSDGSANSFSTSGGAMVISDWGGGGSFVSQTIDVSMYDEVSISFAGSFTNGFNSPPTEFFEYTYDSNSGPVTIPVSSGAGMTQSFPSVDVSSLSTMTVGFNFNVNGSSDGFTITSMQVIGTVLPVTLTAFNAKRTDNGAMLEWTTASEENNDYFSVEMSRDAARFSESAQIKGNGTTESLETYSYEYTNLAAGTYYFRLRQVDYDGQFAYSDVVSMTIEGGRDFDLIANTVHDYAQVEVKTPRPVRVLNTTGVVVAEYNLVEGMNTLDVSALTNGMYILTDGTSSQRFVK